MLSPSASLWIMLGGASGALCRMFIITGLGQLFPGSPYGMLLVNTIGCLLIGIIYSPLSDIHLIWLKYFLIGGFLGAFTTFSTYALDVHTLYVDRRYLDAIVFALLTPVFSLIAVFLGALIYP